MIDTSVDALLKTVGLVPVGLNVLPIVMTGVNLLTVAVAVLFMIGFLKHNRSSKGLFILGAILQFVASLLSSVLPLITISAGYANATMILSTLGGGLFLGSFAFLGWLFLGLYFGAQTDGAAQTASIYSDPISHDI